MSTRTVDFLTSARRTLAIEKQALEDLERRLDGAFVQAVELLAACKGKVIVSGMGKSGLIGQKIAATLASTGTPAFFLHPAEGAHGDLGVVRRDDAVLLLSNSGETREIIDVLPRLKRLQVPLIALTGNPRSTLGSDADVCLDVSVREEACPLGLAPTASTTVLTALGDALAVALLEYRGFTPEDFAAVHPGGALGKRLLTRVHHIMHTGDNVPLVGDQALMREALWVITDKRLGACGVQGADGRLAGVITDGDIRRALEDAEHLLDTPVTTIMTRAPKTIGAEILAAEALNIFQKHAITCLFVVDECGRAAGVLHLHDVLRAGVV